MPSFYWLLKVLSFRQLANKSCIVIIHLESVFCFCSKKVFRNFFSNLCFSFLRNAFIKMKSSFCWYHVKQKPKCLFLVFSTLKLFIWPEHISTGYNSYVKSTWNPKNLRVHDSMEKDARFSGSDATLKLWQDFFLKSFLKSNGIASLGSLFSFPCFLSLLLYL